MGAGRALVAALAAAALAGCGGGEAEAPAPAAPDTIGLSTPSFKSGGAIPAAHTCDGAGTAPTVAWRGLPAGTVELVFVVDDPDAPDGSFTHWTLYGLPAVSGGGLATDGRFPAGFNEGRNSAGETGWTPPCPPEGDEPHRYVFTMYALRAASGLEAGAERAAVDAAVERALAYGRFTGTYRR